MRKKTHGGGTMGFFGSDQVGYYLIASLNALRALARTVLEAGFAENIIFSPVKGLVPSRALVAGLLRIFSLRRPGRVKTPGPFLPSCSTMMVWRESRTATTCFLESSVCSAMVLRTCLLYTSPSPRD